MTVYCHAEDCFSTTMGSDVDRDCMYLELVRGDDGTGQLVAEAIWHDDTNDFTIDVLAPGLPLSVLELFVSEARMRLPPVSTPVENNFFVPATG